MARYTYAPFLVVSVFLIILLAFSLVLFIPEYYTNSPGPAPCPRPSTTPWSHAMIYDALREKVMNRLRKKQ